MIKTVKQAPPVLKAIHLFSVSIWVGSSPCLLVLFLQTIGTSNIGQLLETVRLMYWTIVFPGAFGVLVTGIIYSATTNLGFFKITGIIIAYATTVLLMLGGMLTFLAPLNGMILMAESDPSGFIVSHAFILDKNLVLIFMAIQAAFLSSSLFIMGAVKR